MQCVNERLAFYVRGITCLFIKQAFGFDCSLFGKSMTFETVKTTPFSAVRKLRGNLGFCPPLAGFNQLSYPGLHRLLLALFPGCDCNSIEDGLHW